MIGLNKWRLIERVGIAWESKSRRVHRVRPSLFALTALSLYIFILSPLTLTYTQDTEDIIRQTICVRRHHSYFSLRWSKRTGIIHSIYQMKILECHMLNVMYVILVAFFLHIHPTFLLLSILKLLGNEGRETDTRCTQNITSTLSTSILFSRSTT
jgi:hypothetical protein